MDNYKSAQRLQGLDKQNPQIDLKPLSQQLKATNIGSGDPTWKPPNFYLEALKEQVDQGNHQYVRSFGSIQLVKAIAKFHEKEFYPHKIDPLNEIVTTNGASQALFCCFIALLNPGDEAIFFDPAYDCYRSQIHMAGGKAIGIPLKPKKTHKKQELKLRINEKKEIRTSQQDQWCINFSSLQNALSQKTKILLINSPHHPVGKVFTQEQFKKIANLLQKYPRIVVIEDNVYDKIIFDQLLGKRLPKIIYQPSMYDRTVSIYTSGNILAATGARLGWAIGSPKIIQSIRSVHTYNVFCTYNVVQNAIAKSLQKISDEKDTYLADYAKKLQNLRNILVKQLVNSKLDIDLWIPKGSNFLIADITRCQIKQKYLHDENGKKIPRDHAFSLQLIQQKGVYVVPCSNFYDEKNVEDRERYVQFAFCKDQQIIKQAISKLNKNN